MCHVGANSEIVLGKTKCVWQPQPLVEIKEIVNNTQMICVYEYDALRENVLKPVGMTVSKNM